MKKYLQPICIILLVLLLLGCFAACGEPTKEQLINKYGNLIDKEMRGSFDFFWNETQTREGSPAYGLVADRANYVQAYGDNDSPASIASVGFGLAAYVIGAERGYVTKTEAQARVEGTLNTLLTLQTDPESKATKNGFFTHFLDMTTAQPSPNSEYSSIDTAIMLCGALTAAEYFGGETERLANQIYSNVDWTSMRLKNGTQPCIAMTFNGNTPSGPWDFYAEQLMIYVLGAGSPNQAYRLDDSEYYAFTRKRGNYNGHRFYYSWFGSIFTYQFSHAFIDFRNKKDEQGTDWWENSVQASLADYEYCKDNSGVHKTFRNGVWGLTACDGVSGYCGFIGSGIRGWDPSQAAPDERNAYLPNVATVAPCGALGSVVFTPKQSLEALAAFDKESKLNGRYGLVDSYNLDKNFYASSYIGIDKGITLCMLYNYVTDGIWTLTNGNEYLQNGLNALGITAA